MDASSRDDFIIAIRSAFLKKENKQRFSLIFLIIFSLIFLVLGRINFKPIDYVKITIKEAVYRSSFVVSIPENYLKKTYQTIKSHFIIYNDYFEIKSEIKENLCWFPFFKKAERIAITKSSLLPASILF